MIRYSSTGKVRASAAEKIQAEVGSIRRRWWQGALGFDPGEIDGPVVLSGAVPLFRAGGIPDEDELFMAFADAAFILERLEGWSKRFRIKWHIHMNGDDWGAVDPTGLSRPLLDQMEKWARRAGAASLGKGRWAVSAERHAALDRKHKGGGSGEGGRASGSPPE